jgi:hypothetical protein
MNFDPKSCILILKDKSADIGFREDAADSLMYHPKNESIEALMEVLMDQSEDKELRREVAGCISSLWGEKGIDYEKLDKIPEKYKRELLNEYKLHMGE